MDTSSVLYTEDDFTKHVQAHKNHEAFDKEYCSLFIVF